MDSSLAHLPDVSSALRHTSGGTVYTAASLLYGLRDFVSSYFPSFEGLLATVSDRLSHTEGASTYTVGGLLYGIRDLVGSYLPSMDSSLAHLPDVSSALRHTSSGTVYTAASLLYGLRDFVSSYFPLFDRSLSEIIGAIEGFDVSGIIDVIETVSSSVVQQLEQLPGILQSGFSSVVDAVVDKEISIDVPAFDSSSIVSAIDRLIDVVEGLDVSPEVTVDVENQTEQGLNLLDALLGVLDVAAIAASLSSLSSTLESSFPFGALFMVASALAVLSATPVAPSFTGVVAGVTMEIDLSPFDSVAALCRALLLVLYVIGLYHATRDWVFHSGGGDS